MFDQNIVDKISDEFQSTFALIDSNHISNMFYEREIPRVTEILIWHLGECGLKFHKGEEIAPDYFIWTVEVTEV